MMKEWGTQAKLCGTNLFSRRLPIQKNGFALAKSFSFVLGRGGWECAQWDKLVLQANVSLTREIFELVCMWFSGVCMLPPFAWELCEPRV